MLLPHPTTKKQKKTIFAPKSSQIHQFCDSRRPNYISPGPSFFCKSPSRSGTGAVSLWGRSRDRSFLDFSSHAMPKGKESGTLHKKTDAKAALSTNAPKNHFKNPSTPKQAALILSLAQKRRISAPFGAADFRGHMGHTFEPPASRWVLLSLERWLGFL